MPNDNDIKKIKSKNLAWEASEFIEYNKNTGWYAILSLVCLVLAGIFIWIKQYLSAVVVVLAFIVLFTQSKTKPKTSRYSLDSEGLTINDKKYFYKEMKSFWLVMNPEGSTIYIKTTQKFRGPLSIYLGDLDPNQIITYLKQFIPENEAAGETTTDKITRLFKF